MNAQIAHLYAQLATLYHNLAVEIGKVQEQTQVSQPTPAAQFTPVSQPAPAAQPAESQPQPPGFDPGAMFGNVPAAQPSNVVPMQAQPTPTATIEDVRNTLAGLHQQKSPDAVISLLRQFNVQKLSELQPAQYPQIIAMAQQALSGGAA